MFPVTKSVGSFRRLLKRIPFSYLRSRYFRAGILRPQLRGKSAESFQ